MIIRRLPFYKSNIILLGNRNWFFGFAEGFVVKFDATLNDLESSFAAQEILYDHFLVFQFLVIFKETAHFQQRVRRQFRNISCLFHF